MSKFREYGHDQTIHGSNHVDVETDENGTVIAVWFRCQPLPFRQSKKTGEFGKQRAKEMQKMYHSYTPKLHAVVIEDNGMESENVSE